MDWTIITADDLKAAALGHIVDKAATTAIGGVDPVTEEIANAVARVRRAVSAGNTLDVDPAKVPPSLKGLTVRMALFALHERLRVALSEDQKDTRKNDNSDLLRIADRKVRVEEPSNPDVTLAPQNRGNWNSERKVIGRMHPVPPPGRQHPGPGYANTDGLEDSTQ
jgi:hypothetical protein